MNLIIYNDYLILKQQKAKLEINFIKNCEGHDHIIKILDNSTMKMNENCELFSEMCSKVYYYQTANVRIL